MKKTPYAGWHKAVLIGCLLLAVLGTIAVIGGVVKASAAISEYGAHSGPPLYFMMIMALLAIWLFAGSGALLVYIARGNRDIIAMLESR